MTDSPNHLALPPLPDEAGSVSRDFEGEWFVLERNRNDLDGRDVFTAEQMRAYAQAAVLAERERCAQVCEALVAGKSKEDLTDHPSDSVKWGEIFMAEQCAAAIRDS